MYYHQQSIETLEHNRKNATKKDSYITVEELAFRLERCDRREKITLRHKEPLTGTANS